MKKGVMAVLVISTLLLLSSIAVAIEIPEGFDLFPRGGEDQACRLDAPECDEALICVNDVCRSQLANIGDFNYNFRNEPIANIGGSGVHGGVCRDSFPRCIEQNDLCFQGNCWNPEEIEILQRSDINEPELDIEDRIASENEDKLQECQRVYDVYVNRGVRNSKCQPLCFGLGIPDPNCCRDASCPVFEPLHYTSIDELESTCIEEFDLFVQCEEDIDQPPEVDICEDPNPEDIVEGGAIVTIISNETGGQIGRRIDFCHSDIRVRHVECYEDAQHSSITPCPRGVECEGGRCGELPPASICTDNDVVNNEFELGIHTYRDGFEHDYCMSRVPQGLIQRSCVEPGLINCDEDGCQYTSSDPPFRCAAWCENGVCAQPPAYEEDIEKAEEEYEREFDIEEFDPQNIHYSCEDTDGGNNPNVAGSARLVVTYRFLGFDIITRVIRNVWDTCGDVEGPNGAECSDHTKVYEAVCAWNDELQMEMPVRLNEPILCEEGTGCVNGACVLIDDLTCEDSDGGDNIPVWGRTNQKLGERDIETRRDKCTQWNCYEYFCQEQSFCERRYDRPQQVPFEDSNIVNQLEIFEDREIEDIPMFADCIDYDFGDKPFFGAYAKYMDNGVIISESDQCINEETLREVICVDGEVRFVEHQCERGCDDRNGGDDGYPRCRACENAEQCREEGAAWCDEQWNMCQGDVNDIPEEVEEIIQENDLINYPHYFETNDGIQLKVVVGANAPAQDNLAASDIVVSLITWGEQQFCNGREGCEEVDIEVVLDNEVEALEGNYFAIGDWCSNDFFLFLDEDFEEMCEEENNQDLADFYENIGDNALVVSVTENGANVMVLLAEESQCRRDVARNFPDPEDADEFFPAAQEMLIAC
jgi:hypothetical protein